MVLLSRAATINHDQVNLIQNFKIIIIYNDTQASNSFLIVKFKDFSNTFRFLKSLLSHLNCSKNKSFTSFLDTKTNPCILSSGLF